MFNIIEASTRVFLVVLVSVSSSIAYSQYVTEEFCLQVEYFEKNVEEVYKLLDEHNDEQFTKFNEIFSKVEPNFRKLEIKNFGEKTVHRFIAECYLNGVAVEKNLQKVRFHLKKASEFGDKPSAHMLAHIKLFRSDDLQEQKEGFSYFKTEYDSGSAYSAGKLGWAYQLGKGVDRDEGRAIELYMYAAKSGMTYWQYLLAHAHEQGYYNFKVDLDKKEYWLKFQPKIHLGKYECWVATFYNMGIFPENNEVSENYHSRCEESRKSEQSPVNTEG